MRIFISSVRRGLEVERDALRGLIMAIGHEPSRFEDFGAQPEPSREACLTGVAASDVYLLLLGPNYGHRFAETGQSPTHDEWVAATTRGMLRLVFRKTGVDLEPEQEEFVKMVGDYSSGVFYAEFADVADLQIKVAGAIREVAAAPSPLTFEPLVVAPAISWRTDWDTRRLGAHQDTYLEVHIVPLVPEPRSARLMRQVPAQLASALRTTGALPVEAAANVSGTEESAVVELQESRSAWDEVRTGSLLGVRFAASGQLSFWSSLPSDTLGAILDPENLAATLASQLRLAGSLNLLPPGRKAIAVGLGGSLMMVSRAKVTNVSRSRASMGHHGDSPIRVLPDESVSASALDRGAAEVAQGLAASIVEAFDRR